MIKKKESSMKTKIEVQFQERNIDVKDTETMLQQQKMAKSSAMKKH